MDSTPFRLPSAWPAAFDGAAAERLIDRVHDTDAALAGMPGVRPMLQSLGGNSPFLSDLAVREVGALRQFAMAGPDAVIRGTLDRLDHADWRASRDEIAATVRYAKRVVALTAGAADIGGIWPLEAVTAALSNLAEATLRLVIRHLMHAAHEKREIRLSDPDHPDVGCGFVALAMGKLGAGELNYSSDIDLILIYEPTSAVMTSGKAADRLGAFTSRLARDLVTLMEARDANGYVFRTDLRLRPDPSATPPAISIDAALVYYESMGQNWERAAMIKARPVAGDLALGFRFLDAIRPFVWRRGLDFAAVADIHAMRRKIEEARKTALAQADDPVKRIAGHNVKLGEGGIREIEFLVQTLQMVWGGREPSLRIKPTLDVIRRLVETGHLQTKTQAELDESYRFLRRIEHRLQMVHDRQTHSLPDAGREMDRIACFLGYADSSAFARDVLHHAEVVRENYRAVFESVPPMPAGETVGSDLDFRGDDPEPAATIAALRDLGYQDGRRVVAMVRRWLAGRVRALRSSRARELMTTMLPAVLAVLGQQPDPDGALARFDRFVSALPAGVQPMSLFQHNPALLERVAAVLGAAPMLSEHLTLNPSALEGLLGPGPEMTSRTMLRARLQDARTLEDAIRITSRAVKERDFFLSVGTLEGRLDADVAGRRRTALADAAIALLLPRVLADFASRYGEVPGGSLAVVAMGKAGGREMMPGSDLDLIFVYDHPPDVTESQGARHMAASQWFIRAVAACIAALTAPGPEGQMYALDMRLRPSGNKGPLAVSLSSFQRYHQSDSWTWERMALTRARIIAGPPALRRKVWETIAAGVARHVDPAVVRRDAVEMRARMARDLRPYGAWDVKQRAGGLVDIEFIAQVLQLVSGSMPRARCQTTRIALRMLALHGVLAAEDASVLIAAEVLWRTIQGMLRMTVGRFSGTELPSAAAIPLLAAVQEIRVQVNDAASLLARMEETGAAVRKLFHKYIGVFGDA